MLPSDREAPHHESAPFMEAVNGRRYEYIEVSDVRQGEHGKTVLHNSGNEVVDGNLHDR